MTRPKGRQPHTLADPSSRTIVRAWLPPVLWGVLVWFLGSDGFSAPETSRILVPLMKWLLPDLDIQTRAEIVGCIRKLAHPSVYGVLAALAFRAASLTIRVERRRLRAGLALLPVALLAIADEWRQSASTVRTGTGFDVLLDLAGGLAIVAIALGLERRLGRPPFI